MTTGTLSNFMAELSKPFEILPGMGDSARLLRELASALRPFAAHPLSDFVAFLHKAEEYRKSGTVVADSADVAAVRHAVESLQTAVSDPSRDGELSALQATLADALVGAGQSCGLIVGKPKADKKWADTIRSRAASDQAVRELNAVAAQIGSIESLNEPVVVQKLADLEELPADVLKAAASQVGVGKTTKKGRELVLAALATITKLPLDAKAKVTKAKAVADDATLLSLTSELKAMANRASSHPDAVSDAEIEAILVKVEASGLSDAQMKEVALAVTGVKETTKKKALLSIRGKLTAAKRILEDQKS